MPRNARTTSAASSAGDETAPLAANVARAGAIAAARTASETSSAFAPPITASRENIFLTPATGLSLSNFGAGNFTTTVRACANVAASAPSVAAVPTASAQHAIVA
jgi:hypothetical protein